MMADHVKFYNVREVCTKHSVTKRDDKDMLRMVWAYGQDR